GKIAEGLAVLQRILDYWQDSFIWLDGAAHPTSVRRQALQVLGDQPADVLEIYERVQGREAARLLEEAAATGHTDRFQEVSRRFFFTEAGFQAVDWQASRWLDRGQFELAAEHWRQLLS